MKAKRITIWQAKGGQGKTSLALAIAFEFGFYVVTNDTLSPIADILPEGEGYSLSPGEDFPPVPEDIRLIYDLGGKTEDRVITAAKNSDVVIMPLIYNNPIEMQVFLESVAEMADVNNKILLVVNACKPRAFAKTKAIIQEALKDIGDFPIVEIKETSAFRQMVEQGMSIKELCESSPLLQYHYGQVNRQVTNLMTEAFKAA